MADNAVSEIQGQTQTGNEKQRFLVPPTNDDVVNTFSDRAMPSLTDGLQTVQLSDFKKVHQQPCARDSLLYGIGAGFGVGGARFVLGGGIPKASNWAVASFVGASLISYEYCQYRRNKEKEGMKRAMEIIERKRIEKEQKVFKKKQKALQEAKDKVAMEATQQKSWYKLW